jgi:hypothetical protein
MMNWKGYGRKQLQPTSYSAGEKPQKNRAVMITSVQAKIKFHGFIS